MMRNLLSLDGGGIRGFYSLKILARIEQLLREHFKRPQMVLADYFHYIGGTSTGAIIAGMLSWGRSVDEVTELYRQQTKLIFARRSWWFWFRAKYDARTLSEILKKLFSEDGEGQEPSKLGTERLRTRYLCVMRNASTGSSWVITNCKGAKFNDPSLPDCNLKIPLYKLIRASSAAPIYFPPESISAGDYNWVFLDGGISPYNNPAFLMYLTATLPVYGEAWPDGSENLRLISVGTGRYRTALKKKQVTSINVIDQAKHAIPAMIDAANVHQDLTCRALGRCICGEPIDLEVGDLVVTNDVTAPPVPQEGSPGRFLYCRYNHEFKFAELEHLPRRWRHVPMDDLGLIPFYEESGAKYAADKVKISHLV